jgi:hypothetical protein
MHEKTSSPEESRVTISTVHRYAQDIASTEGNRLAANEEHDSGPRTVDDKHPSRECRQEQCQRPYECELGASVKRPTHRQCPTSTTAARTAPLRTTR